MNLKLVHPPSLNDWRILLRQNFTKIEDLAAFLELTAEQQKQLLSKPRFILNVPLRLAKKMHKGTLEDPLLLQFIPLQEELKRNSAFKEDPVGDQNSRKSPKLLHKYKGRVLLVTTSACAMNCRFCFRQNFDYEVKTKSFAAELSLIAHDSSIQEVILSGGDPLSLSNEFLKELLNAIGKIPHIERIRFHTRFPIGIPERIDEEFLNLIGSLNQQVWFVVHINHARELDEDILARLKQLQKLGCSVLSQSVLLQNVNDTVESLKELFETLVNQGIFPYYLHQLDRVQGAAHFEVSEEKGKWLIEELTKQLPGYAIPKYVREIEGEPSKTLLI